MIKKLIIISLALVLCIAMMVASLLIDEKTFGQVSSYLSIGCVLLSIVGVVYVLRSEGKDKKK